METRTDSVKYKSRKAEAIWNLVFQVVTILLAVTVGIVLVPLYLEYIPISHYGAWLASGNLLSLLVMMDPGISAVVQQRAAGLHGGGFDKAAVKVLMAGLLLTAAVSALLLVVGNVVSGHFEILLGTSAEWISSNLTPAWKRALCGAALMLFVHIFVAFGNAVQESIAVGIINVLSWACSIAAGYVLLCDGAGLVALGSMPLIQALTALVCHIALHAARGHQDSIFRNIWGEVRELSRGARTLVGGRIAFTLAGGLDTLVVARILGVEAAASLALLRRLPETGRMVVERPWTAVLPSVTHFLAARGGAGTVQILTRIARWYAWLSAFFLFATLTVHRDFVSLWIGAEYWGGGALGLVIVCASLATASVNNAYNTLVALGGIRAASTSILRYSAVYVLAVVGGTWALGAVGFVLGAMCAGAACLALTFRPALVGQLKGERLLVDFGAEFVRAGIAGGLSLAASRFTDAGGWLALTAKAAFFLLLFCTTVGVLSKAFRVELNAVLIFLRQKYCAN